MHMGDFAQNLSLLIRRLRPRTMEHIAHEMGIGRTTLSRLKAGSREPSDEHLALIASFAGLADAQQLRLPHEAFKQALEQGKVATDSPLYGLRIVAANLAACKRIEPKYSGQYVLYTPTTREGKVVASLLEIGTTTSNGISVSLINPHNSHEDQYEAFEYRGFMVPISEYLYVFAEQLHGDYEVLTLIFHAVPVKTATMLEGVQNGVGVIKNRKWIGAVCAVAYRLRSPIANWRDALGSTLGYVGLDQVPRVVLQQLVNKQLVILR